MMRHFEVNNSIQSLASLHYGITEPNTILRRIAKHKLAQNEHSPNSTRLVATRFSNSRLGVLTDTAL
jgi:hypothetical protein